MSLPHFNALDVASKISQEFRKFSRNCNRLHHILRQTKEALSDISGANIFLTENICRQALSAAVLDKLSKILDRHPTILVLGQNCNAKATLINFLLGESLLPMSGTPWRWVRIHYGHTNCFTITSGLIFKDVNRTETHEKYCITVPEEHLRRPENEKLTVEHSTVLEVQISHPLLRDNVQLIVPPDQEGSDLVAYRQILHSGLAQVLPVLLFALGEETLTDQNIHELHELKEVYPDLPVFFICTSGSLSSPKLSKSTGQELRESKKCQLQESTLNTDACSSYSTETKHNLLEEISSNPSIHSPSALLHQLASIGYLHLEETKDSVIEDCNVTARSCCGQFSIGSDFLNSLHKLDQLVLFVRGCLQAYLIQAANMLNEVQAQCLRRFILSAFDMAREIQITPRRIQYAQVKEAELYKNLMIIASEKQEEIQHLIQGTLQEMRSELVEKATEYHYHSVTVLETEEVGSVQEVRVATSEIHYLVLNRLSNAVAAQLVKSVDCLQDTYVGTLQRCLESLERNCYEQEGNLLASDAVKQILSAAYNVELTTSTSSSLMHSFLERLRKLLRSFQLPWTTPPRLDASWRKRVATEMLDSLSASRLARSISAQFRDRVRTSHESFHAALRELENHYSGHLERTEEQRVTIRKRHAPRLARLALESTSMCDMVRFGMPQMGKEIGRGQYGVVFSCERWGDSGPCAVKSVVPPDDKHWNDLAMEFYYTRTIPEHRHIVRLLGSVVDTSYGGGCPSVLLVMDRLSRDLYCGLRSGLKWLQRLQIAIDVVEGIRYLHSQGLVHRDIKLKNVLLDLENRAKLTDLGFCIPEAMMSGSIVGTPVHMAPELLSGHYDSSVDVYAFGILFWYICAGHVHLPYVFEQFQNKEQLWTSVKKGIRPERLPHFDDNCWQLMEQCWSGEPSKRPLLGYVLPQLESVRSYYFQESTKGC